MKNKKVLITGGTGFVGANLARRLLSDGHEVHLLLRRGYSPWRIEDIQKKIRLHETNLSDLLSLKSLVGDIRPDWIFHLAVYGAYSNQTDQRQMVETNIIGTMNLVEASLRAGFEAFVNTGSSSEYGYKDHAPSETELLKPNSPYALAKANATLFCQYIAHSNKVLMPTLRLYSVYGPYEEPTRFIPTLIREGLKSRLPPLVNPDIARDFVYVDDVCDAYILAATTPGQAYGAIYNVGTGVQTSIREAVETARKLMGIKAEPVWGSMPDRRWDTSVWVANPQLIQEKLAWKARSTFEQGLSKTISHLSS